MLAMGKTEQLIEYIVQDVLAFLMEDRQIPIDVAMRLFYASKTFEQLHDTETGLYLNSSAYIYTIFREEMN